MLRNGNGRSWTGSPGYEIVEGPLSLSVACHIGPGDGCDVYEESVKFGFFVLADSTENVRNTAIYSNLTHMSAEGEKG